MNLVSLNRNTAWMLALATIYGCLTLITANNGYFWDNILQVSKEAHWFYWTNFRSLFITPGSLEGITPTGYHPPLIGLMTACLWKIFGYKLWVSTAFTALWAIALFVNVWKLLKHFVSENYLGPATAVVLLEPTILTQLATVSPDFILLTAFVISLRAIIERKRLLLAVGLFFLCVINMRGLMTGVLVFAANSYYEWLHRTSNNTSDNLLRHTLRTVLPYLPALLILILYYTIYLNQNGWFIDNTTSNHYAMPPNGAVVIKHAAGFVVRTMENGRFLLWFIGGYAIYTLFRDKHHIHKALRFVLFSFFAILALYVVFIFITQMPFNSRYFMPLFLLLTIIAMHHIVRLNKCKSAILFVGILVLELTGHFWIYPDKISKSWDSTLAHLSYYDLRDACFEYMKAENIPSEEVAAGFCLYGDQRFITLQREKEVISRDTEKSRYFIHSNISNNTDQLVAELYDHSKWHPVKRFEKGFVHIILFKKNDNATR